MSQKTTYKMQHNFGNKIPSSAVCTAQQHNYNYNRQNGRFMVRGVSWRSNLYCILCITHEYSYLPPNFRSINKPTSTYYINV